MPPSPPDDHQTPYRLRRRKFLPRVQQDQSGTQSAGAAPAAEAPTPVPTEGTETPIPLEKEVEMLRRRVHVAEKMALAAQSEKSQVKAKVGDLERQLKEKQGEVEHHENRFREAQRVVDNAKAQMQRTRNDMDQQRRRFERETENIRQTAEENLLRDLFPVLDSFLHAIQTVESSEESQAVGQGVRMIHRELMGVLEKNGLEQLSPVGQTFDPKIHEASATEQDTTRDDGEILRVIRPGYLLRGKVLRPAMVVVNKTLEASTPPPVNPEKESSSEEETSSEDDFESNSTPLDHAWRMMQNRDEET